MHSTPITEADLDFIDATLKKYGCDKSILSVSELNGFLTALVSGPEVILQSEWMRAIWGGEEQLPEWETEQELSRFIFLVMAIMNQNSQLLMKHPEAFEATFLTRVEDGDPIEVISLWCYGYRRAVALRRASWSKLSAGVGKHMGSIILFGSEQGEVFLDMFSAATLKQFQDRIDPAVRALHAFWHAQRGPLRPSSSAKILPFAREENPKA